MQTKTKFVFDLGNGHMAYDYPSTHGRPFAQWHPTWDPKYKAELEAVYEKAVKRVGPERAKKMAHFDHHILIFPNLAIVDNHGIMIRTYFSKKPAEMLVQSWTLAPQEESPEIRKLRLYSYMDFLGPAGFGTPDDVEAIEAAQRGYKGAEDYGGWNDISAGVAPKDPMSFVKHGDEGRHARVLDQVAGISVELAGREISDHGRSRRKRQKPLTTAPPERDAGDDALSYAQGRRHPWLIGTAPVVAHRSASQALWRWRNSVARGAQPAVGGRPCGAEGPARFHRNRRKRIRSRRIGLHAVRAQRNHAADLIKHGDKAWEERVVLAHYHLSRTPPFISDGSMNENYLACHREFHMSILGALWLALAVGAVGKAFRLDSALSKPGAAQRHCGLSRCGERASGYGQSDPFARRRKIDQVAQRARNDDRPLRSRVS